MPAHEDLRFLPIAAQNTLVERSTKSTKRHGMDNDDDHYDEVTPDGEVVAKFHVWHHMNTHPPFATSAGWKKLSLAGDVIAEGSLPKA